MFSIVLSPVIEACWQIEHQAYELNDQIIEMERVIASLSSLSGMEECMMRLRGQLESMRSQQEILRQMMQALNKVIIYYTGCENRICDNAEQSSIHFVRRQIGENDLTQIAEMIGEFVS